MPDVLTMSMTLLWDLKCVSLTDLKMVDTKYIQPPPSDGRYMAKIVGYNAPCFDIKTTCLHFTLLH